MRGALVAIAGISSLLSGVSCGKGPGSGAGATVAAPAGSTPARGEQTEDETRPQPPREEVGNLALARAIDRKICRKRGCCVSGIEDAGTDRKGRSLAVATIGGACLVRQPVVPEPFGNGTLDKEPCPIPPRAPAAPSTEGGSDGDEQASEEAGSDSQAQEPDPESEDCAPYEYHLIVHSHGKIRERQLLSQQCNNGYGAAGVGEDTNGVDKEAHTYSHGQSGGSAWRWERGIEIGFDPLRVISIDESSFWTLDQEATSKDAEWNHDTFQGSESWGAKDCEARRKENEARDAGAGNDESYASLSFSAVIIPRVQLPPAFVQGGWRSIALGNCGAFVDGDQQGFAVYGGKGAAADASLRAVVSTDSFLFVEITDDRWTTGGKTWVKEDHIELWAAPQSGSTGIDVDCDPSPAADPSVQWGIRISDGQVFPAFGSPAPLTGVEVVRSGHTVRVRIPVAEWLKGKDDGTAMTIVYSDSDDGLRQKRLIATSQIERGHLLSLGHVRDVDPDVASCVLKGKTLQIFRPPLTASAGQAIADP
jgi:hypothetical protein